MLGTVCWQCDVRCKVPAIYDRGERWIETRVSYPAATEELRLLHRLDMCDVVLSENNFVRRFDVLRLHNVDAEAQSACAHQRSELLFELQSIGWRARGIVDGLLRLTCPPMTYERLMRIRSALEAAQDEILSPDSVELIGGFCGYEFLRLLGPRKCVS